MERLFAIIRNKYVIASTAFLVWMLFFDRHDVTTQYDYYTQLKELKAQQAFYTTETERVTKAIKDLNSDPKELERVAREKYKMKRENEDIFVIVEKKAE